MKVKARVGKFWHSEATLRYRRNRLAMVGTFILLGIFVLAVLAPYITQYPAEHRGRSVITDRGYEIKTPPRLSPCLRCPAGPVFENGKFVDDYFQGNHFLGTDSIGRDIFTRVLYGARTSFRIAILVSILSAVIGIIIGGYAGFFGGWVDMLLMRFTDILLAFPYLLSAIVIVAFVGRGESTVIIVLAALGWMSTARLFRSSILREKEREYAEAARAMGASRTRILWRHLFPNALAPIVIYTTITVGDIIIAESALSFLGVGILDPTPSWGLMISSGQRFFDSAPHMVMIPAIAIVITVLSFMWIGEGLRDALDPRESL